MRFLWVVAITLFAAACGSGVRAGNPMPPPGRFDGVSGQVTAQSGPRETPLAGVSVEVGSQTTVTDERGLWRVGPVAVANDRVTVSFRRGGFAPLVRVYQGRRLTGAFLSETLLPVSAYKRIEVRDGGSIVVPGADGTRNDVALRLPPNFAVLPTGSVDVAVTLIRPQVPHELAAFPGDFVGQANGLPHGQDQIRTFGTVDVSFSSNGRPLGNVALAKPAELLLRLAPSVAATSPEGSTVPTWTLRPENAQWVAEGNARIVVQNGEKYAAWSATHFTWWNVDKPLSTHACVAIKLIPANADDRALLEQLSFTVAGVDYAGVSVSDDFADDGVAVVNGWLGHQVRPIFGSLSGQADTALTELLGKMVFGGADAFMMPTTQASVLYQTGPGGVPLVPARHCLYIERPFGTALGRIRGQVLDEYGETMAGAVVGLAEMGQAAVTNADGEFGFDWMPWNEDGSLVMHLAAIAPARSGASVVFTTLPLVRDNADAIVTLVAEPVAQPPTFTLAAVTNSAPPAGGSTGFSAVVEDDNATLLWGIELCGRAYSAVSKAGEEPADKIVLCHSATQNHANLRTVSVATSSVNAHLAHGDTLGLCPGVDASTPPGSAAGANADATTCKGSVAGLKTSSTVGENGHKRQLLQGTWQDGPGHGRQTMVLLAKDPLGNVSRQALTVDFRNNAPVVFVDAPRYPHVGDLVVVAARASDPDGDTLVYRWRYNGSELTEPGAQLSVRVLSEGPNYVELAVSDGVATVTQRITLYVVPADSVDGAAPDTQLLSTPPMAGVLTTATFTFASPDTDTVRFECRLDGGAFSPCVSPRALHSVFAGIHTFAVRAVDAAGNADPAPAFATWEVVTQSAMVFAAGLTTPPVAADDAGRRALLASIIAETFLAPEGSDRYQRFRNFMDLHYKRLFDANATSPIDFNPYTYQYRPVTSPAGPYTGPMRTTGAGGYEPAQVFPPDDCIDVPLVGTACLNFAYVDIDGQADQGLIEYAPAQGTFGIRTYDAPSGTYRVDVTVPVVIDSIYEPPTDAGLFDLAATDPANLMPGSDLSTYLKLLGKMNISPLRFSYRVTMPTDPYSSATTLLFYPVHIGWNVQVTLNEFGEVIQMSVDSGFQYLTEQIGPFCNSNLGTTDTPLAGSPYEINPLVRPFGFDGLANYPGLISDPATSFYSLLVGPYPHVAASPSGGSGVGRDRVGIQSAPYAFGTSDNPNNCARPADACVSADPLQHGGPDAGPGCELPNVSNNTDDATYGLSTQWTSLMPYIQGELRTILDNWGFMEWDY